MNGREHYEVQPNPDFLRDFGIGKNNFSYRLKATGLLDLPPHFGSQVVDLAFPSSQTNNLYEFQVLIDPGTNAIKKPMLENYAAWCRAKQRGVQTPYPMAYVNYGPRSGVTIVSQVVKTADTLMLELIKSNRFAGIDERRLPLAKQVVSDRVLEAATKVISDTHDCRVLVNDLTVGKVGLVDDGTGHLEGYILGINRKATFLDDEYVYLPPTHFNQDQQDRLRRFEREAAKGYASYLAQLAAYNELNFDERQKMLEKGTQHYYEGRVLAPDPFFPKADFMITAQATFNQTLQGLGYSNLI